MSTPRPALLLLGALVTTTIVGFGAPPTTLATTTPAANSMTAPDSLVMGAPDETLDRSTLSGILQAHLESGEFVGARVAVLAPDGTVTEVAVGNRSTEPGSPAVELDTPWGVGSITKSFVAVVVLQLAEEGLLDLDAGIETHLPDLADADRITPRQLLQHTSGLGEYLDQPAVDGDDQRVWEPAELIDVAEAGGRVGPPGGAYHYSNTNFIVLGEIIEQVTGTSWFDAVRTRIIEPLGLVHTAVIDPDQAPGFALDPATGSFEPAHRADPSTGGAAGALESTGRDLLRFAAALGDGTLLSAESTAAMQSFVPGEDYSEFGVVHGYGLGLERYTTDLVTVFGHLGVSDAQSAFIGYDPETGTAVAVGMNSNNPGPQALIAIETLTLAQG